MLFHKPSKDAKMIGLEKENGLHEPVVPVPHGIANILTSITRCNKTSNSDTVVARR